MSGAGSRCAPVRCSRDRNCLCKLVVCPKGTFTFEHASSLADQLPSLGTTAAQRPRPDGCKSREPPVTFCHPDDQIVHFSWQERYLENPVGSIQWPVLRRIFAAEILAGMVRIVDTDMCCFGTLWKKPTRLLLWGPGLQSITFPRCCGKGGFCSVTGKRHFQLSSATSCAYGVVNGRFRTRDAQEYPPKFVACLLSQLFAASGH